MSVKVTKEMLIEDLLQQDPNIAGILTRMGMHCIGCMAAAGESLEEAMIVHGYGPEDVDVTVQMLNEFLEPVAEEAE